MIASHRQRRPPLQWRCGGGLVAARVAAAGTAAVRVPTRVAAVLLTVAATRNGAPI